jgi:hypothetical protein
VVYKCECDPPSHGTEGSTIDVEEIDENPSHEEEKREMQSERK